MMTPKMKEDFCTQILGASRQLFLSGRISEICREKGTQKQLEFILELLQAELTLRDENRRKRLIKHNQPGIRIASAHIHDKFDFLRSVLVWVVVGTSGTISKRVPRAVISAFPAVNILSVGFVFDSSFGDTIFFSIFNQG